MNEKSLGYLGKALLIELRPLPVILAILAALFGGALGFKIYGAKYPNLLIHVANVVVILYSAHLIDTYNDVKRGEYQRGYKPRFLLDYHDPKKVINLNPRHYMYAMLCTYLVALILSGILLVETGIPYALLAISGLLLSMSYGFGLDRVFIIGDLAWESGVVLAFIGGFYVTAGTLTPEIVVMTLILLPILLGAKILDAHPDLEVDLKSKPPKKSIPVKLGSKNSKRLAYILILIPAMILFLLAPMINISLIFSLIIAISLVLFSYRYDPIKGIYLVAAGIMQFLVWAVAVLLLL